MIKPTAGYRPLAYSSPEVVQTTGTVAVWRRPRSSARSPSPNRHRDRACQDCPDREACADARRHAQNMASFPDLVLCCAVGISVAASGTRDDANRLSGRGRAFRGICGIGGHRNGGVRIEPKPLADHRVILCVAGILEYLQHLSPGRASRLSGFRGLGAGSALWWGRYHPPLALSLPSRCSTEKEAR
jgi:hypothetical protein